MQAPARKALDRGDQPASSVDPAGGCNGIHPPVALLARFGSRPGSLHPEFLPSRALFMHGSATGLGVRLFGVTIAIGLRVVGRFADGALSAESLTGSLDTGAGTTVRK